MVNVNIKKFEEIVEREKAQVASLPEHTLDWYTYTNRVTLLEEVASLFEKAKVEVHEPKVKKAKHTEVKGETPNV